MRTTGSIGTFTVRIHAVWELKRTCGTERDATQNTEIVGVKLETNSAQQPRLDAADLHGYSRYVSTVGTSVFAYSCTPRTSPCPHHLPASCAFLTPSLHYVAVLARHPDLPQRVLRQLPRTRELFVVQHGWMRDATKRDGRSLAAKLPLQFGQSSPADWRAGGGAGTIYQLTNSSFELP